MSAVLHRGVIAALAAAVLFGASTPFAKLLLAHTGPWLLAGLLYLGSGIGLWLVRALLGSPRVRLEPGEGRWLAGAIVAGGIVGPVLLMAGLAAMPASGASLLLNAEGVLTALLAWFVFRENFDRRVVLGEPLTWQLSLAGLLMGLGVWLHLTERHIHEHVHEPIEHSHEHVHDGHAALRHTHAHYPDVHHQHHH